jgi:hypothetical protein
LSFGLESKFEIFGSNRLVFVKRTVGECMISSCVVPNVKHGGGGVMVWDFFAGDTVCNLFRIQGTFNQHDYLSILQRYTVPYSLHLVGLSFVFQQDNDPKHTSRLCIEMVLVELDHRVKEKQPASAQHMRELLQDCWKTIPGEAG